MKFRLPVLISALGLPFTSFAASDARELYTQTKSIVEQWVEAENLISEERNQWKTEEALLSDTQQLLESEKKALQAKLEDIESSATIADEKRASLLDEKEALEASREVLIASVADLEDDVKRLLPRLPEHFKEGAQAVIRRIPEDSQATKQSLSHRMRNIVALLSQASKFDNTITLRREVRDMADGSSREVTALYFGFATAYFADPEGTYAGLGYPTDDGWVWEEAKEYGPAVLNAIAMYENNEPAAFVTLPVTIK